MKFFLIILLFPLATFGQLTQWQQDSVKLKNGAVLILCDFDGQFISSWDVYTPGNLAASSLNSEPDSIAYVLDYMSELFAPFNVIVTDDSTLYPVALSGFKMKVIFTATCLWHGCAVGGVSLSNSLSTGVPSFVFDVVGNDRTKAIAGVHEAGHQFGLSHQGVEGAAEYNTGYGSGQTGFAPVMGSAYTKNMAIWWNGTVGVTSSQQLDINGIKDNAGIVIDDVGSTVPHARKLNNGQSLYALIAVSDSDYYKIDIPSTATVSITVVPKNNGASNADATLDAAIDVYNHKMELVVSSDNTTVLNASVSTSLSAGVYFIKVRADRDNSDNPTGYGFMGHYTIQMSY